MRISDWSSDVCSADLSPARRFKPRNRLRMSLRFSFAFFASFANHLLPPSPLRHQPITAQQCRRLRLAATEGEKAFQRRARAADREDLAAVTRAGFPVENAGFLECRKRRSEEHTSELQSLMRLSYAVFCLKKKNNPLTNHNQL